MRQAARVPGAGTLARGAAAGLARGGAGGVIRPAAGDQAAPVPAAVCVWPVRAPGAGGQGPRAPGGAGPGLPDSPGAALGEVYPRAATSAGDARAAGLRRAARAARRCAAPSRRDASLVPGCGGELTGGIPPGCSGRTGCSPAACVLEGRAAAGLGQRVTDARRLASGDKRGGLTGAPASTPAPMRAT